MCCTFNIAVMMPLLAILAYLTAVQPYSWLLVNLVADLAAINLVDMNLAVDRSISLRYLDLAVLSRSHCAAVGKSYHRHLPAGQSSSWLLAHLVANLAADIDVLYPWPILLISRVRQKLMSVSLHCCCCFGLWLLL
jgi:hypothetical protein